MKSRAKQSAGLLLFRTKQGSLEVFLVHMGGPFWQHKEDGAWTIPKGEFEEEAALAAAKREFREETGLAAPNGQFFELQPVKQSSGKVIFAWAVEGDCDATKVKSNTFALEWPKGSGLMRDFPEIDRAGWFAMEQARAKILNGQAPLLDQLATKIPGASG